MQNQISSGDDEKPSKFPTPRINPGSIKTDSSMEFIRACKELNWSHERSAPRRTGTNEIAERALRRVKEGTSPVLVQSGRQESWWAEAMECYCYLRNLQDLPAEGQTPYERRMTAAIHCCLPSVTTSGKNLKKHLQKKKEKPEIQVQIFQLDKISGKITFFRMLLLLGRNSMFRLTISDTFEVHDVQRQTKTCLDVLQRVIIGDYWNMDGDRSLCEPWIGMTPFALLDRISPKDVYGIKAD